MYYRIYRLSKTWLEPSLKSAVSELPLTVNLLKGLTQALVKSTWEDFYHIFSSLWGQMISKLFRIGKFEILSVFINTFADYEKYPVSHCEMLPFPIQMQLSYKRKTFSQFLVPFFKSSSNVEDFCNKDHRLS